MGEQEQKTIAITVPFTVEPHDNWRDASGTYETFEEGGDPDAGRGLWVRHVCQEIRVRNVDVVTAIARAWPSEPTSDRAKRLVEIDAAIASAPRGVYIASKSKHGPRWVALRDTGVPIISTWIDESGEGQTSDWQDLWDRCIREASTAAAFVMYVEPGEVHKGSLAEVGAALHAGVPVFWVGPEVGSVRRARGVTICVTIEEAMGRAIGCSVHREVMRDDALAGLSPEQRAHLTALADPARRARFNGSTARIELLSVLAHPHRPEAARAREHLNAEFGLSITVEDLARALGISPEDMLAIEVGTKTTDDAGWKEILTACFLLGSGTKPEHIAAPASSPAFQRAMGREEGTTLACRGCAAPCEVDPGTTAHLCADCTGEGKTHEMLDGPQTDEDRAAVQREIARSHVDEEEAWARVLEERAAGKRDVAATEDDAPEETEPAAHSPEAMWRDLAAPAASVDEPAIGGEP
jgi:hypothetical protein